MRKTLLFVSLCIMAISGYGQCTPDPIYASETFGFWPDTDLPNGVVDVNYSETVDIKSPLNGGELNPAWSIYDIDSIAIDNVAGLPDGYTFSCNPVSCVIPGGEQACMVIEGTTTMSGDFPLTINLTIYATISGVGLALPFQYADYTLEVLLFDGVEELSKDNITLGQSIPNPMQNEALVPFTIQKDGIVTFAVFNIVGEKMFEESFRALTGSNEYLFDADGLTNGVYLYSISIDGVSQTKRMLVKK